jgi:uncharacterized membrane protein YeaQ/YmgE (transglycosylase-associated protein family)
MDFTSFLILLIISIVVCAILHHGCKYNVSEGSWSFCSKIIVGWIGAWQGTPVFGNWLDGLAYGQIYYIPAILGSAALVILAVDLVKGMTGKA